MPRYHYANVPDPDHLPAPLAGLAIDAPAPHDSGLHGHRRAQLMYAVNGVLQIHVGSLYCILPPTMAAWIPAGLVHRAQASKPFAYRSLYFDPAAFTNLPAQARILGVGPLLREAIARIANWPLAPADAAQQRLVAVLMDELLVAPDRPLSLVLPQDRRLRGLAETLLANPGMTTTLKTLAANAGASGHTVNRLFKKETGMGFSAWRQQLRVMAASRWLTEGEPVASVAERLGYAQESAFIAMFRRFAGVTPGQLRRKGHASAAADATCLHRC